MPSRLLFLSPFGALRACAVRILALASALATLPAVPAHAGLLAGLQAYYKFDGNGVDSSGDGRNLTLVGSPGFATGLFGQALSLHADGSQYASGTSAATLNFGSSDFTIQTWVDFNSHSREMTLIEKFSGHDGPGWTLTSPGDHFQFWSDASGPVNTPDGLINPGTWEQVVARRDGNTFDVFVNGQLEASATSSLAISGSPNPLLVGRRDAADGRDFSLDGRLDETAIWTRALTDGEIGALWNGGMGAAIPTAVPEPTSCALVCVGVLTLWGCNRRRRETE